MKQTVYWSLLSPTTLPGMMPHLSCGHDALLVTCVLIVTVTCANAILLSPPHLVCDVQVPLSSAPEAVFHQAWNQVVDDLRERDLLSNAEASSLKYTHLSWGPDRQTAWLLLPK